MPALINWMTNLSEALKAANTTNKPVLMFVHRHWCKSCKDLVPKINNSSKIQELSKKFIMLDLSEEDEPKDSIYAPDGQYVPRQILFICFIVLIRSFGYFYLTESYLSYPMELYQNKL